MQQGFFSKNRSTLLAANNTELYIFSGNVSVQRSNDASYAFEQEANFWYLTGISAAGWKLVIEKDECTLIAPDVDEVHRIFDGSLSNEKAKEISRVDRVLNYSDGEAYLKGLNDRYKKVGTLGADPHADHYDFSLNPGPLRLHEKLAEQFSEVIDCRKPLAKQRAIKQPEEIQNIRDAIALTIEGFEKVKLNIDQYTAEYEIEADFSHHFRRNGADGHAYDPIVAAGKNACTLHYGKNRDALEKGVFVLLDIGARYKGYAADITRTYAFGEVSDRYRSVHAAVENAHEEIIALLKPGLLTKEYLESVDEIMKNALNGLGLLSSPSDYRKYFPHAVSHGLGIDVHDSLGGAEKLLPGMVLTVEPGIYIPEEGIGVRIEDDILITESGNENLSAALSTSL